jgi:N-acetylglucosaminyl-diphospho-decaprenol L-rhamnosyltransferase
VLNLPDVGLADITVVLVTYNSAHCLRQMSAHLAGFPYITIVDNGSQDDIADAQKSHVSHATLIRLPANVGYGAANNIALRGMQTPFALLLNPDCVLLPNAAQVLLQVAKQFPDAAVIAPQIVKPDGSAELSYRWPSREWISRGPVAEGACCVGFVTGAAMLLRMEKFSGVGFFDEDYFLYYEDEDLCQRLFKSGLSIIVTPDAQAVHASRSSVKEGFPWRSEYIRGFHHAQSKLIFEAKHGQAARVQALRWKVFVLAVLTLPLRLLALQPKYLVRLVGRIAGLWSYRQA